MEKTGGSTVHLTAVGRVLCVSVSVPIGYFVYGKFDCFIHSLVSQIDNFVLFDE